MKRRAFLRSRSLPVAALALLAGLLAAPASQACAVCFGQTDSPLGKGLHWGVLVLLAVIFLMLAAFGAFAVFLARRAAVVDAERAAEEAAAQR